MSDLRSVQFDVCDGDDEVVSIASDIYIYIQLSVNSLILVASSRVINTINSNFLNNEIR